MDSGGLYEMKGRAHEESVVVKPQQKSTKIWSSMIIRE